MRQSMMVFSTKLALLALVVLLAAPAAFASPPTLEGSWRTTSTLDGATESTPGLFTFAKGGTLIASNNTDTTGNGHGTWKRLAGRTFAATNIAFVYDSNGVATQIFETEITFRVSWSGNTFRATFETSVQTLDGTVLATASGTATGERIGD
ncbi:MAG: hypothetical protein AAGC60_01060 [Acidobacteriota bacterium]